MFIIPGSDEVFLDIFKASGKINIWNRENMLYREWFFTQGQMRSVGHLLGFWPYVK